MKKLISTTLMIAVFATMAFSQEFKETKGEAGKEGVPYRKFSVSTTWLSFANIGEEKTNTHHYEFHFGYNLTQKTELELKSATWKLFAPMGIPMWDPLYS